MLRTRCEALVESHSCCMFHVCPSDPNVCVVAVSAVSSSHSGPQILPYHTKEDDIVMTWGHVTQKKLNHPQAGVYWLLRLYGHKSSGCTVFTTWRGSHVQTGTYTHTHAHTRTHTHTDRLIICKDKGEVNVWQWILEAWYLKRALFLCWIPWLNIIVMN